MQSIGVESLNHTVEKTHMWLQELAREAGLASDAQAYSMLRAVLHTLRDRLTVDECAHLAAQMPMLIRGMYYEGWKPARSPVKYRTAEEFLGAVAQKQGNAHTDPEHACRCVFGFLDHKIAQGEIEDVRRMLPAEVRDMFPFHEDARDRRRF